MTGPSRVGGVRRVSYLGPLGVRQPTGGPKEGREGYSSANVESGICHVCVGLALECFCWVEKHPGTSLSRYQTYPLHLLSTLKLVFRCNNNKRWHISSFRASGHPIQKVPKFTDGKELPDRGWIHRHMCLPLAPSLALSIWLWTSLPSHMGWEAFELPAGKISSFLNSARFVWRHQSVSTKDYFRTLLVRRPLVA